MGRSASSHTQKSPSQIADVGLRFRTPQGIPRIAPGEVVCEVCDYPAQMMTITVGKVRWHHRGRHFVCAKEKSHVDA
jgi:hypothetical protein